MADILKNIYNASMLKLGKAIERRRFDREPIIIGASPRSGTTILLSILGAHPHIFAIPNQTYAFDIWEEDEDTDTGSMRHKPVRIDRIYREFVLNPIPKSSRRWCEKTPKNIQYFDKILEYYENRVRLIHIVRDGRDVVVSKHPKHNPDQYWVPIERWIGDTALAVELEDHPNMFTLRYEDLVLDFASSIEKICRFIDEPITAEMQEWLEHTNVRKSKHLLKPVENLYKDSIGRWRDPGHKERIAGFMRNEKAVELLKHFNYLM